MNCGKWKVNEVKKILSIIAAGMAITLLAGCVTNTLPKKLGPDDCLVIIKTDLVNKDSIRDARAYKFNLTDKSPSWNLPQKTDSFVVIRINRPDVSISEIISYLADISYVGPRAVYKVDIPLPYEPGKIIIFDRSFVRTLTLVHAQSFNTSIAFDKMSEDEINKLTLRIKKLKGSDLWEW